jgi:hypothetical protein
VLVSFLLLQQNIWDNQFIKGKLHFSSQFGRFQPMVTHWFWAYSKAVPHGRECVEELSSLPHSRDVKKKEEEEEEGAGAKIPSKGMTFSELAISHKSPPP